MSTLVRSLQLKQVSFGVCGNKKIGMHVWKWKLIMCGFKAQSNPLFNLFLDH